jgi:hypothetical protein
VLEGAELVKMRLLALLHDYVPHTKLVQMYILAILSKVKNTIMADGAKANHLAYLGDSGYWCA